MDIALRVVYVGRNEQAVALSKHVVFLCRTEGLVGGRPCRRKLALARNCFPIYFIIRGFRFPL